MRPLARLGWTLFALACACGRPASTGADWGIQAVSLRRTFGDSMLDFRFKVVDAVKAKKLFDKKLKPYLFDPKSRIALGVPDSKLGALRASVRNPPVAGKQYYVMFSNALGSFGRGRDVTVVMGDCKLEHVVVE
jgi:hypothetical protein